LLLLFSRLSSLLFLMFLLPPPYFHSLP
jgi:hypothetical protein